MPKYSPSIDDIIEVCKWIDVGSKNVDEDVLTRVSAAILFVEAYCNSVDGPEVDVATKQAKRSLALVYAMVGRALSDHGTVVFDATKDKPS